MIELGAIAEFKNGKSLSLDKYSPIGQWPVYGSNGKIAKTDEVLNNHAVISIGRVGAYCGAVYAIREKSWVTDNAIIAEPKEGTDFNFLYYLLKHLQLNRIAIGSAQPLLTQSGLKVVPVSPPPSLGIQKMIGEILKSFDDKIDLNIQINQTLESIAKSIFKEWFIDFGPVKAKADGNIPFGMDTETASHFPDSFQECQSVMIPKGWRIGMISDIADYNLEVLKKTDDLETIEYIEISSVSNGYVNEVKLYPRGEEPSRARRKIKHGDTILSTVRPDRAAYFLALNPKENQIVSTGFVTLTPKDDYWSFLHAAVTRLDFFEALGRMADGGAYPAISPEVVISQSIVLPPVQIISSFHKIVSRFYDLKEKNIRENKKLIELKDLLLPKLISGEIELGDLNV